MRLRIDRIAVEIDETRAAEASETIREALSLLAERLATAPAAGADARSLALDLIDIGPVDPRWLTGPAAADRLSEELYRRIVGATAGGWT